MSQLPATIEPKSEPENSQAAEPNSIGALLGKRAKAARASFLLGLALFGSAFLAFVVWSLEPFSLGTTTAALLGFLVGGFYLVAGLLWSLLWSLTVHLNLLVDDLAEWIGDILQKAVSKVRETVASGEVVDLRLVREQIDRLVEKQSNKLTENKRWGPVVNEYAPVIARQGLRALLFRFSGKLWPSDELTIEQIEKGLTRFGGEAAVFTIRRILWIAIGVILLVGLVLVGLPLGIAQLVGWILA